MSRLTVLTSNTGQELACKKLDMSARKWRKAVCLQEVKHTLSIKVGDDAYVVAEIKAVPQVDAFVPVMTIVLGKCRENSELNP
jgi:hypothetical protein